MRKPLARRFSHLCVPNLLIWFILGGCGGNGDAPNLQPGSAPALKGLPIGDDRGADAAVNDPLGESVSRIVYLPQNWSPATSEEFYFTSQGSQILPYDWFIAIEQAGNTTLFRDNQNMLRLRYLIQRPDSVNPDGLPVGFVKDSGTDRAWLGLTCAACHTAQIDFKGVGYRVDGGPAMADVRALLVELADALRATRDQDPKFDRFAKRVLGHADTPKGRATLKEQLTKIIDRRDGYNARNFPPKEPPGYGRVDAFGAILNEVYHQVAKPSPTNNATTNTFPADAPVSYPCLWDTPQHDKVQWNGIAKNAGLGILGRDVGEVLGVFGEFAIPASPTNSGYSSTVQVKNLRRIEEWVKDLWSPVWPSSFPPIDNKKRDLGEIVYKKARCDGCHEIIKRDDRQRRVTAHLWPTGTDSRMYDNFSQRVGDAGRLKGAYQSTYPWPPLAPVHIGERVSGEDILAHVVIGTIRGSVAAAPEDELTKIEFRQSDFAMVFPADSLGGIYKARPLNGIWATAPYLHNGSVASLYQLLLPAGKRLKRFTVGTRQFNDVNVGFRVERAGIADVSCTR